MTGYIYDPLNYRFPLDCIKFSMLISTCLCIACLFLIGFLSFCLICVYRCLLMYLAVFVSPLKQLIACAVLEFV